MSKQWIIIIIISIVNFIYADITEKYEQLEKDHRNLHTFVLEGDWLFLEKRLQETNFPTRIEELEAELSNVSDPSQEQKKKQIQKWTADLKIWMDYISDGPGEPNVPLSTLLDVIDAKILLMEKMYHRGKETGREYFFTRAIEIHNNIVPELLKYKDNQQYKKIQQALKKFSFLRNLTIEELIVFEVLNRVHINGTIYLANSREQSIAFLNNKVVRVNDHLPYNFVVKEIRDGKVVLEYKNKYFVVYEKGLYTEVTR